MPSALGTIVKDAIEMSVRGHIPGISFDSRSPSLHEVSVYIIYRSKILYSECLFYIS